MEEIMQERERNQSHEPDVMHGELPRFVELLRMSHGPVDGGFAHCSVAVEIEEVEDLPEADYYNPDVKTRAIFKCAGCSRFFWGWWD